MQRTERDSLGEKKVPDDAYYGIHTVRAVENFPISGLKSHDLFIDSYVYIKKAAAIANKQDKAIVKACDEILSGKFREFPVDVFQMGAGTSIHMNINEVIANRATEILGGKKGEYKIHPNDDVNYGQSTNDTFPTAMRISALLMLRKYLYDNLDELDKNLSSKGKEFKGILKSARTHLQDAVPIKLGQEFDAYAMAVRKSKDKIKQAERSLLELGIGGSAAGTGLNTKKGYREEMVKLLSGYTGLDLVLAGDLREAMQSQGCIADVSSALRNLSLELNRISNDLRLLSSGPTTGLKEIKLPAVAPGSSIMPGKVNPSILEMVNMVCYQVIGCDTVISHAVSAGQLELNVMMPVMSYNLNFAIMVLGNAVKVLNEKCISGIKADERQCRKYFEDSIGLGAALNPIIGYEKAADVVKEAIKKNKTILEIVREKKILTEKEIEELFV
jgi:aspartate ammonia-lyase